MGAMGESEYFIIYKNMLKNIYQTYSKLTKPSRDSLVNAIFALILAAIFANLYDWEFINSFVLTFFLFYILDTISYFRGYLTSDRRYTLNIDNTRNIEYLVHTIKVTMPEHANQAISLTADGNDQ